MMTRYTEQAGDVMPYVGILTYCDHCGNPAPLDPLSRWCDACSARLEAGHMLGTDLTARIGARSQ